MLARLHLLVCAAALFACPATIAEPSAQVQSAVVAKTAKGARLTLQLDRKVEAKIFALPAPRPRLVIDLPANVQLPERQGQALGASGVAPGAGPVQRLRFGPLDSGGARLVLDLAGPADAFHHKLSAAKTGARLVVDVEIAAAAVAAPVEYVKAATSAGAKRRVIAIDAGHGGKDPGTIGRTNNTREKDVTLAAALALRTALERRGYVVAMTREGDEYLTLPERVGAARRAEADLFISLHADSSPNAETKGASIYTLSEAGSDRAKGEAERRNWELDLTEPTSPDVQKILMDLAQRDSKNRSALFARELKETLAEVAPLLQNAHRQRGFFVLLAPDMPAVLLEMAFLTNAEDEARIANAQARRQMMAAVADAVDAFFAAPAENAPRAIARAP
ncbi:MAG: N-acetylmuramoyl-L-alanine amidase [Caulobacterales bacterium]